MFLCPFFSAQNPAEESQHENVKQQAPDRKQMLLQWKKKRDEQLMRMKSRQPKPFKVGSRNVAPAIPLPSVASITKAPVKSTPVVTKPATTQSTRSVRASTRAQVRYALIVNYLPCCGHDDVKAHHPTARYVDFGHESSINSEVVCCYEHVKHTSMCHMAGVHVISVGGCTYTWPDLHYTSIAHTASLLFKPSLIAATMYVLLDWPADFVIFRFLCLLSELSGRRMSSQRLSEAAKLQVGKQQQLFPASSLPAVGRQPL